MFFDDLPLWGIFLITVALSLLAIEAGFIGERRRLRQAGQKPRVPGAMVGATTGLLAFMLAFTFSSAADRHDVRKALVMEEANAIGTVWLRAGLLPEPYRADVRGLLREYVDLRARAAQADNVEVEQALRQSDALQATLWAKAAEIGQKNPGLITVGLFIQSLDEMIDLHLKRVTVGMRDRIPATIWVVLYVLACLAMGMMGSQAGVSESRHFFMELALALSFSVVLFLIVDLDRPQQGLIRVSQQAMVELQDKLNAP
jgi:hypothetical protein